MRACVCVALLLLFDEAVIALRQTTFVQEFTKTTKLRIVTASSLRVFNELTVTSAQSAKVQTGIHNPELFLCYPNLHGMLQKSEYLATVLATAAAHQPSIVVLDDMDLLCHPLALATALAMQLTAMPHDSKVCALNSTERDAVYP
jgi:hypothetical protein